MSDAGEGVLKGVERAAVLLLMLGEEGAASVLQHMGPCEVQKLGASMSSIRNVSQAGNDIRERLRTTGGRPDDDRTGGDAQHRARAGSGHVNMDMRTCAGMR